MSSHLTGAQRPLPILSSIRGLCQPDDIMIGVSGDGLRTHACPFVHNGRPGDPTTERVRLPRAWPQRLGAARAR